MNCVVGCLLKFPRSPSEQDWCILPGFKSSGHLAEWAIERASYRLRGYEIANDQGGNGEHKHDPKVEVPSKLGILCDEAAHDRSNYW